MTASASQSPCGLTTTTELGTLGFGAPRPSLDRFALIVYRQGSADLVPIDPSDPIVVGRDSPADVRIDDPLISRQHARFSVRNGALWVEDLDSRNGTRVNGGKLSERSLLTGDRVEIGSATLVVAQTAARALESSNEAALLGGAKLREVYAQVERAARVDAPVVILGETGVGKDHVARHLHAASARARGPFVALNCATIPPTLVTSTLFGHERGAFTGAAERQAGVFERAHHGVLFLDEIGELSLQAQPALLRVLETKTFTRVGGGREVTTDARVVAATHCDLEAMVAEGTFREDLYYRLSTLSIDVPPLRERLDEMRALVEHFLDQAARQWNVPRTRLEPGALQILEAYDWPGNVRQLRNVVERAALLANGAPISARDLPTQLLRRAQSGTKDSGPPGASSGGLKQQLRDYEAAALLAALERTGGNRSAAARLLCMPTASLFRRLKVLGIDVGETESEP